MFSKAERMGKKGKAYQTHMLVWASVSSMSPSFICVTTYLKLRDLDKILVSLLIYSLASAIGKGLGS